MEGKDLRQVERCNEETKKEKEGRRWKRTLRDIGKGRGWDRETKVNK